MYCIQAIDEEALGLLRWLATSQAGEDINSDDELVRETILSPLLPATTIDKVLEKANMDYESESQKECQDILDSIDDLSDFEGLKEGASHCSDQNHSSISSSEKMIPQIDGSTDDLFSVPCAGSTEKSFEIEMRSEFEGVFGVPVVAGCNCAGRFMKNADTDVHDLKESCTLVGCSVLDEEKVICEPRDLMRRKRSYRVEPPDDGSGRTKKVLLEGEQREGLLLGHKQLNDELDKNPIESLSNLEDKNPILVSQFEAISCSSDSLSQASRLKDGNFGSHEKVGDEARIGAITGPVDFTVTGPSQVHTRPWICKPKTIDSAASMGHREIDNVKESGFGVTAIAIERFQQIGSVASSCLQTGMVECGVSGADCSMGDCREEEKELMDKHARISDSNSDQVVIGVPTHTVKMMALTCAPGGNNVASVDSSPLKGSASSLIGTQSFLPDDCDKDLPESGSGSHVKPILDHLYQENPRIFDREMSAFGDGVTTIMQGKGGIAKDKSCSESTQDMSQISGPDGKSKPTPLSQSGFRDPASVQAESRGDLRPNPRFDAINVIALAIQNDTDSIPEVYVLLCSKTEAFKRSLDGTSGCKMLVFSEEKYLFSHFMKIVCSSDPDIIMGWDIQGGSLGFLAERASHLGIGLLNNISRTPSEIKIAAGDLDIPEKGNFDNLIPEQSNTDPVILEDAIIEDEWGRTHASGVHVGGRIVLNIWQLMRGEVKLNMYTIEAVAEAVLRRKIPSFRHKEVNRLLLQPAMECLPLVMEPESGFYADPVVVLDFQSLYPSMIIAYNLCFSTCLGKVAPSKANTLGVSSFSPDPYVLQSVKNEILLTPNGVMYVTSKLALKLISNVTYGYTAAGFSGRMPCAELADSIVQCGRSTLEKAISFVNAHDKWKAKVIYGDTDSLFVLLKGRTVKESFRIGNEIASAITAMNPKASHIENGESIETVRRDTCGAIAKTLETSLRHFFEHQDISKVKAYLQRQWTRILSARVSLQDFVFAKEVRLGTYCTRGALHLSLLAAIVATKAMRADPKAKPYYAERIPYVVIHGEPGARLIDMASAHLCNQCLQKEAAAATAVIGRTSKLEREMQHLAAICRHCGGSDWVVESGVKCTSLACSVFYERWKV
uniref:DNA polymerase n=1 Tax=Fagus sylvatica TaxID=28930 RepID=A0A2N9ISQ6_FAGSY